MEAFVTMDKFEEVSDMVEKIDMPQTFYAIEDIQKYIEPDIRECYPFAIRLSQQKANTPYEKKARTYLLNMLNKIIIFDEIGDDE